MITDHLPVLQVVIPLLAAPLCVVLRGSFAVRQFVKVVSGLTFLCSLLIFTHVTRHGAIGYELGGWQPPWGIEYRVDALNAFLLLIISGMAAVILPYGTRSILREIPREQHHLFLAIFLVCVAGLLGIAVTADIFNVFVFLEISALSSYALIGMGRSRRALTAAYQYLIMGTIGSTFLLIGIGLLYMKTGTLNMADLALRMPPPHESSTVIAAFAFLSVGVSIKLAVFPLHTWLPNAYTFAPSMVTAFLAATATKVSFYLLLRIVFTVFGVGFAFEAMHLQLLLPPLALAGIFVASTVAIFQTNIKRLLAFSSIAQIGYMVLGLSFGTATGLTAGIVHLFNHAVMKSSLFLAIGCVSFALGAVDLRAMRGLGRRMPFTMAAFLIGGLNLIGIPFTAGFVSKWYLILAALEQQRWFVAGFCLLSSLLAAVYIGRVVEAAYFHDPDPQLTARPVPRGMLAPLWLLTGASLFFGIFTSFPVGAAQRAALLLLGGAP